MLRASARRGRLSDAAVEKIITTTLETKPKAQTHWSTRQLGRQLGFSPR